MNEKLKEIMDSTVLNGDVKSLALAISDWQDIHGKTDEQLRVHIRFIYNKIWNGGSCVNPNNPGP